MSRLTVYSGPGHLGDVLTGHGKINFYTRIHTPSWVSNESKQGTCDAPFDTFGHELTIPALEIVEAVRDETDGIDRHGGVGFKYMLHRAGCPCQCHRGLNGFGTHRIARITERPDTAECVSRTDVSEDDLVSLRRQLRQLDAAPGQNEEPLGVVSFVKEERAGRHRCQAPEGDD